MKHASGLLFAAILALGLAAAVPPALSLAGAPAFEGALNDSFPPAFRRFWGRLEYALFREGRKGVIIGEDGWLFTDEEFSCPPRHARNLAANLDFTAAARDRLAKRGAALIVALVPAKARVAGASLPSCRASLYADLLAALAALRIPAADLSTLPPKAFLKTDTHWTPEGARAAARAVAALAPSLSLAHTKFTTRPEGETPRAGDLLAFLPGAAIAPEPVRAYHTLAPEARGADLLGDTPEPEVALVGTSYSANPAWHFEGFLKEALSTDLRNAASEGQGPFAAMSDFLEGGFPTRLVVWEMPERYFLSDPGVEQRDVSAHPALP